MVEASSGTIMAGAASSKLPSLRQRNLKTTKPVKAEIAEPTEAAEPHQAYDAKAKTKLKTQGAVGALWTPGASRLLTCVMALTLITRLYKINDPSEVVFDEVHFGGFASNYLRREYFFDVHPPLGKLLIAAVGFFLGYEGNFTFGQIGLSYVGSTAPYVAMRTMMVMFGMMTVGLSFMTLYEMGFSSIAAAFSASLIVFDMASCIQSRFILLDSPLMGFISAALYSWVRFRQQRTQPFSRSWWTWLAATGASLGAASSVKMVGLFTVASIGLATIEDLWALADKKRKLSDLALSKHFFARALCLIALPLSIYCASFYVHFAVLNRTGTGDGLMSPAFQATLIGNQLHQTSRLVRLGQTVRFKSRLEEIFLHSHAHNYPQQHLDGKISSAGQQVTGYPSEDPNNLWKIVSAGGEDPKARKHDDPIENGDVFRLLHVKTNRYLMTHDVASPLTRTNMEVTLCDGDNEDLMKNALWKVEITNGDALKTRASHIKIINALHGVALTNWQQPLPAWGFGQREINGDKRGADENSKWLVWDIQEAMNEAEKEEKAKAKVPTMSTFRKYIELQQAIFRLNAKLIDNHPFKSEPGSWPFVLRGISFWDKGKDARIYLLGNPLAWYAAFIGTLIFAGLAAKELYRERRGAVDSSSDRFHQRFAYRAGFILCAYLLHYLPFFGMARTLYLHHYLPSYVMSTMLAGATVDYILRSLGNRRAPRIAFILALITFVAAMAWTFIYFAPIVYGTFMKSELINKRRWVSTWDWTA